MSNLLLAAKTGGSAEQGHSHLASSSFFFSFFFLLGQKRLEKEIYYDPWWGGCLLAISVCGNMRMQELGRESILQTIFQSNHFLAIKMITSCACRKTGTDISVCAIVDKGRGRGGLQIR